MEGTREVRFGFAFCSETGVIVLIFVIIIIIIIIIIILLLCRVLPIVYLKQTMFIGYIALQLFFSYNLW